MWLDSTAESFAIYHVNTLGWPGVGNTFIIEPKNLIITPRARVVYAYDIDRRTYHAGNSNQFSFGICVAGDYRYDIMDEATLASIAQLHIALVGIGKYDKPIMKCEFIVGKLVVSITTEMLLIGKVQKPEPNQHRLLMFIKSNKEILYGALHIRTVLVASKLKV
ncbi:N-acetylmuramoyl-L-alanine amidase [Bacillus sp. ISL-34]|nr:N-acetylmuramoyl-L-alanine amidase [Bacillus sp. ISL-34]